MALHFGALTYLVSKLLYSITHIVTPNSCGGIFFFFWVGLLKWALFHLTIYVIGFHEVDFPTEFLELLY